MNNLSMRNTPPVAPSQPGRSFSALPNDPGLDQVLADVQLGSTAKTIALALVRHWAWYKPSCFPSDRTIAEKIGKSPGHVQRCLKQLEDAGWIRREKTTRVRSGRLIWLLWRVSETGAGTADRIGLGSSQPSAPARTEQVVVEQKKLEQKEPDSNPQRQRAEIVPFSQRPAPSLTPSPLSSALDQILSSVKSDRDQKPETLCHSREQGRAPIQSGFRPPEPKVSNVRPVYTPPASSASAGNVAVAGLSKLSEAEQARLWELPEKTRGRVLQWLALNDSACLKEARKLLAPAQPAEPPVWSLETSELLRSLPGRPDRLSAAASRLAKDLKDARSYRYYLQVAESVCRRQYPAECLIQAWREGRNPQATKPGAVFSTAWKREVSVPR